ncbi:MAG: glycine cleavage system aminomethyltransferase GcvT [Synechococcales cyanobacterium]
MRQLPLAEWHQRAGARFVPFAGYDMPLQFQGVMAEHQAVRHAVGLFDISHMGRFLLSGSRVREQLDALVPTSLASLAPGQSQYTVLLTPQGTILDDVIAYCLRDDQWLLIVNGARRQVDWDWVSSHSEGSSVQDETDSHILLAIQGSQAVPMVEMMVQEPLADLKRFQHRWVTLRDPAATRMFAARTGYTGEDGLEVIVPVDVGAWLWQQALELGIPPCGLGCRDTLRLEAAMHLYGQDMDTTTTPWEAGLGWLVHSDQGDFVGREALLRQKEQGIPRQFVGLQMLGKEIARPGYALFAHPTDPVSIGQITSGTKSPTLGIPIALGYVPPAWATVGTTLWVDVRGQRVSAQVVKRPFYRSPHLAPR